MAVIKTIKMGSWVIRIHDDYCKDNKPEDIRGLSMNAQELSWTTTEEKKQIWHKRPGWSRNLNNGAVYSLAKA